MFGKEATTAMFHRYSALLLAIGLLIAADGATAAEPADASADKTAAASAKPPTAELEEPSSKPAVEADPAPKLKPEQVSYEYVLGMLRTLTEGSERRYTAMEEQIARLKLQIDELNRRNEALAAKKETPKAPAPKNTIPPAKPEGKVPASKAGTVRDLAPEPPAWVGMGLRQVRGDYQVAAAIGPYTRPTEYEAEWSVAMQDAVDCYARRQFGSAAVGRIHLPEAELRGLIRQEWDDVKDYGAGPMNTQHVLLVFEPAMQARIRALWEGAVIVRRLEYAGAGLTSGLLLLGILFACLKLDHSTAGAYRVRLILAGVFLAIALAAGTTAAVQLLSAPPAESAAEDASNAQTASLAVSDDGGGEAPARQATVAAHATSLLVWLGAAVGLVGVLLLFSVGKKPAPPNALKETAVHEIAVPYEPVRHGSGLGWIGLLLAMMLLLLASAFLFPRTAVHVPSESTTSTPPRLESVTMPVQPLPKNGDGKPGTPAAERP
jgi:hypothetical protein